MGYMLCSQTGITVPQLTETLSSSGQGQTQSESLIQCQSLKLKSQCIYRIDSLELYTSVSRSIYLFKYTYYAEFLVTDTRKHIHHAAFYRQILAAKSL